MRADLPVHCFYHEVPGIWDFYIGRLQGDGFGSSDTRCGQHAPGDPDGWQQLTPIHELDPNPEHHKSKENSHLIST